MLSDVVKSGATGAVSLFVLIAGRVIHWLKTDWMAEDRIARAFHKHDKLLHQAERLDDIGQSYWAEEARYRAYRAAVRPLASFETARHHSVRASIIGWSVATFIMGVVLAIASLMVPLFTYVSMFLLVSSCIGVVYTVATTGRNDREIRERIEKKLKQFPINSGS